MKIINFLTKKMIIIGIYVIICVLNLHTVSFALTKNNYEKFIEEGYLGISGADLTFNAKGQMYRKFGHFIIDDKYEGGDKLNPFYNEENSRDLAIEAADGDSTYDVYAEIDDEDIDYSYEDDEDLTATDYDRAAFQARLDAMVYGNTYHGALGYGKYNLRPVKNLTAFIKFAYDFYKNASGDLKVGCKNEYDLQAKGITDGKICPMELLEEYAGKSYISAECVDGAFKNIWKDCTKHWEYDGTTLETTDNIFEHLQDIFMAYVYLKPGVKKIDSTIRGDQELSKNYDIKDLTEEDYAAILSMMYERFGGRPIEPSKVESGNAIPRIGTGDILGALINFPNMSIADKIYTYMIEVKYKNNDVKLASWLKEYEDVMGSEYSILDSDTYDNFMKAYQKAFQEYGQDSANDTLLDYGFVLTPDIFESKISYTEALNQFANTIRSHFGNSSFYNNRNNAQYVAKSYMMAKKMCENSAFSDITDIYAADLDVISHTIGYDSNMILLADTQVVELNDTYGTATDTDHDGLLDYQEANKPELVDISNMVKEYCKYNGYSQAETEQMIRDNGKVTMYSYRSNPVLPDSDFDGRLDNNDGKPLDNVYNSKNETDNYSNISIEYAQDYRYFFMDDKFYYEELAEMGLVLSNMASKKNGRDKIWKNTNSGENYTANNLRNYMWYIGNDNIEEHLVKDIYTMEEEDVPYAIGQHDCVAILGKVNNLQKNIITLVIGENKDYKDILAANYDGTLGINGSYEGDYHHIGYDVEATKIFENLVSYSDSQTPDWKKAYFIVGYGTGGSIANLVAKKMIDLKGNREPVFCYTYQAPNTINRNNLTKRIYNVKYQSIFNIENSDDIMLNLMGDDAGWTKYGVIKRLSVGDDEKTKKEWKKLTSRTYKSGSDFLSKLYSGSDNLDILELARGIYAERMRQKSPEDREYIINSYTDNPDILIAATRINALGEEADLQAKDFTAVDIVMINKLNTTLHDIISVSQIDKTITVTKALEQMGHWYTENVYTYGGANSSVATINGYYVEDDEDNSTINSMQHNRWEEYKASYMKKHNLTSLSSTEKILMPANTRDDGYAIYQCDKFNRLGYVEHRVSDDCSKFAASVFYHFLNRKNGETDGKSISTLFSGSGDYINETNTSKTGYKLFNNGFKLYKLSDITSDGFGLQDGDLLYRTTKVNNKTVNNIHNKSKGTAHVEFYIDSDSSFGWGEIHKSYDDNEYNKEFVIIRNKDEFLEHFEEDDTYNGEGIYNIRHRDDENESACDVGVPYTYVIRYTGGQQQ